MLSYQHEYHAGNHGDILKHICLCSILDSLTKKDKNFTVIDTHASAGRFSLTDEKILKTAEAENGILKLLEYTKSHPSMPDAVKLYMDLQRPYLNRNLYAGSPEIESYFLRKGDVCHFIEKHPLALSSLEENSSLPLITPDEEKQKLGKRFIHNGDSYKTLFGLVPPLIRRGLVFCDPSYEDKSDYEQVVSALKNARKKWNTAILALWYPILERKKNETSQMLCELEDFAKLGLNPCECENYTLSIYEESNIPLEMQKDASSHMIGSGMFIINPPWMLKEKMTKALFYLQPVFAG